MKRVFIAGEFDDLRSADVRFLHEASRLGPLHVLLQTGTQACKFPVHERQYFLESIRYVDRVTVLPQGADPLALVGPNNLLTVPEGVAIPAGYPDDAPPPAESNRKKVLVTGCFDWLHTGHVRFFEEVSEYGDLYAVVGHDANIRLLKGEGHPQFSQDLRRYMVGSIRFVTQALISTGDGWLDAEPEIQRLKPNIYAVNEDGDKPEKRAYCQEHGIEYLVLRRLPKAGLPRRQSTELRGF